MKDKDDKINKDRKSKVFWCEFRGSWSVYASEKTNANNDLFHYIQNGNTVEVIGNIFENQELLKIE